MIKAKTNQLGKHVHTHLVEVYLQLTGQKVVHRLLDMDTTICLTCTSGRPSTCTCRGCTLAGACLWRALGYTTSCSCTCCTCYT